MTKENTTTDALRHCLLDAKRHLEKALSEIRHGNPEENAEALVQLALEAVMKGLSGENTVPQKEPFRVPVKLFELGQIVSTPGAMDACTPEYMRECLGRHIRGDWGTVCAEDQKSNFEALFHCGRLLSAYPIDPAKPCKGFGENTLWIITEADRSATTFLLPNEY